MITWGGVITEPLMLISSWGTLHLSTLLPLESWDPANQCNHYPGPQTRVRAGAGLMAKPGGCRCFSSYARKGLNAKTNVFITSNRSAGQGILLEGGCWCALGTVASSQWKLRLMPQFPSLRSEVVLKASIAAGSESRLPASPEGTGARQGLSSETTGQPTIALGSRTLRPDELSQLSH